MQSLKPILVGMAATTIVWGLAACGADQSSPTEVSAGLVPASCPGINLGPAPTRMAVSAGTPTTMRVLGSGLDTNRYSGEIAARGNLAYLSSWGLRRAYGNKVSIFDVSTDVPTLVDSLIVAGATTTGDVAVSDDGTLLVVATERAGGSIAVYDLANPRQPRLVSQFRNANTDAGVHTAEIGRVNGKLYAFLSIDPAPSVGARLVTVDLSNPSAPREVYNKVIGNPYVHDTFVRSGLLFLGLWDDGVEIWDIGGCGTGASPESPKVIGRLKTVGGQVHNVWWYHDANGSKRYAFIGQEGAGSVPTSSRGDIHVVDLSDPAAPKEVAFYTVSGAGTHNFSIDEANGILYAAYYNGGVRAIDIRGDLGNCDANQKILDAATNLLRCDLRLTGREIGVGLTGTGRQVYIWGVQYLNGVVYASDMVNGIWKLAAVK